MPRDFETGDHVSWNSEAGRVRGDDPDCAWAGGHWSAAFYETLSARDLAPDVLQAASLRFPMVSVPSCGWLDIGTPGRLRRFLELCQAPSQLRQRLSRGRDRSEGL